ncbi:MAG: rRNA maturation RNase YbeY [Clostridiaceae bacterium]|nr:rRNA maturation RNase YbeY [Clostridiaceae bacterium]
MNNNSNVEIIIQNMQDKLGITKEIENLLRNAVEACLEYECFSIPCEISILLVDDKEIFELNNRLRGIDSPTDVLSFPIVEMKNGTIISTLGDMDPDSKSILMGDIVISIETAYKQAEEYGHTFEREIAFLTTHGVFHLLGYDHDDSKSEEAMIGRQEAVLEKLGLNRE